MKPRKDMYDVERGHDCWDDCDNLPKVKRMRLTPEPCHTASLDWMAFIEDECPLSALTIPGTHDSAAYTTSLPFISTQGMDILDQLNAGIRYFDLRCAIRDDVIEMVHGPRFLGLTLAWVFENMYIWLATHPSEALIVQIKEDREEQRSSKHLSEGVFALIAKTSSRWRTSNTTPLLGELRGRIQLFRRFIDDNLDSFGIDVTAWQDNPAKPFTIYTHGVQVTIQDHYNFSDPQPLPDLIATKGGDVSGLMRRASDDTDPNHWYMNFTSAFEFNLWYQLPPRQIAVGGWHLFRWEEGMNIRLRSSLDQMDGRKRRFGIVAMDFPDLGVEDLIPALIETNFDLEDEERRWMSFGSKPFAAFVLLWMLACVVFCTCCEIHLTHALHWIYFWLERILSTLYDEFARGVAKRGKI